MIKKPIFKSAAIENGFVIASEKIKMNKFRIAANTVLSQANKPLHHKEITQIALEKGILETDGATPDASMNAQIIMDIKQKGDLSDFIKTARLHMPLTPTNQKHNQESRRMNKRKNSKCQVDTLVRLEST